MIVAVGGGWLVLTLTASLARAFAALALAAYCLTLASANAWGVWLRAR